MKPELEAELIKLCPNMFRDMYKSPQITCLAFGIETGDGWFDLIKELSLKLENLVLQLPEEERTEYCYAQIKEKFGEARIYLNSGTDEMYTLVSDAELNSRTICETCGAEGRIRSTGGWLFSACDEHAR